MSIHWCYDEVSLYAAWWSWSVCASIGANHCRLLHIGWENCGHGLTSRLRESASELFLNELLSLFRYPSESGRSLLNGTLPHQCCADRFACKTPTWRLPVSWAYLSPARKFICHLFNRAIEALWLSFWICWCFALWESSFTVLHHSVCS